MFMKYGLWQKTDKYANVISNYIKIQPLSVGLCYKDVSVWIYSHPQVIMCRGTTLKTRRCTIFSAVEKKAFLFLYSTAEVIHNTDEYACYAKCPVLLSVSVILNTRISQRDSLVTCWWHDCVITQWLFSWYSILLREAKGLWKWKTKKTFNEGLPQ
jgi:hypothetical protein